MTEPLAPAVAYSEARARLLSAVEDQGVAVHSSIHPEPGPDGAELATDVARFGAPIGEAEQVVMVLSGTHGVEGHAGHGLQMDLLRSGRLGALPPRTAVVVVHAVNPWGMAWTRRVDADNIDVNRNFVDTEALPATPLYAEVDHLLNPTGPELDPGDTSFVTELLTFWERVGDHQAMQVLSGGQYSHPAGVQFGGQHRSWSRKTLEDLWDQHLDGVRRAVLLDIHTGLGPQGRLTVFQTADEHEASAEMGRAWYPEHLYRSDRNEHDPINHGLLGPGFDRWAAERGAGAPDETATFVIEFGTQEPISTLSAFRADNWLHHHGDRDTPTGRAIVESMLDHFWIDDKAWRTSVAEQGEIAIHTALDGLADS